MSRWISVKKRLPEDGQIVLAVGKCGGMGVVRFNYCDGLFSYWQHTTSSHCMNPTHWMPLPEPPDGKTKPKKMIYKYKEVKG